MKKVLHGFLFVVCIATGVLLTNCNNKPAGNTEATTVDTPAMHIEIDTTAEMMPMAPSEWSVVVVVADQAGAPVPGATTKLKKMPGDTECTVDMTQTTNMNGISVFTGSGSCPCKHFRSGVQTTGCTKIQDNVLCGDTVKFVCP